MAASPTRLSARRPLTAERRELDGRAGRLSYYVAGRARRCCWSTASTPRARPTRCRPIFEHQQARSASMPWTCPGFGFSDRRQRAYDVRPSSWHAVHDMLDAIAAEAGAGPIDALAISLLGVPGAGGDRAAGPRAHPGAGHARPASAGPTGAAPRAIGATREVPGLYRLFTFPLWSQGHLQPAREPAQHPLFPASGPGARRRSTKDCSTTTT